VRVQLPGAPSVDTGACLKRAVLTLALRHLQSKQQTAVAQNQQFDWETCQNNCVGPAMPNSN